jgi:hypothetical protein
MDKEEFMIRLGKMLLILTALGSVHPLFAKPRVEDDTNRRRHEARKAEEKLHHHAVALELEAANSEGRERVYQKLSKELDIPVAALREQKERTRFGFGQLFIANSLAKESGKSFEEIEQEFRSGKGWGRIAEEHDLELGRVVGRMRGSATSLQRERGEIKHRGRRNERSFGSNGTHRQGMSSRARRRGP